MLLQSNSLQSKKQLLLLLLLCPQRHGPAGRGNTMALKDERSPKYAFPEAGTSLLKSPTKRNPAACCLLLPAAPACCWLLPAPAGCCWLLLAAAGCCCCCWLPNAGCCWLLLPDAACQTRTAACCWLLLLLLLLLPAACCLLLPAAAWQYKSSSAAPLLPLRAPPCIGQGQRIIIILSWQLCHKLFFPYALPLASAGVGGYR